MLGRLKKVFVIKCLRCGKRIIYRTRKGSRVICPKCRTIIMID